MIKNFISIEEQAKIELIEDILFNYIPTDYEMLTAIEYLRDELQDTFDQLEKETWNPIKPRHKEYIDLLVADQNKLTQQLTSIKDHLKPYVHTQSIKLIKGSI